MAVDLKKTLAFLDGRSVRELRAGVSLVAALQALLPLGLVVTIARAMGKA
jgi:hypothetical protein